MISELYYTPPGKVSSLTGYFIGVAIGTHMEGTRDHLKVFHGVWAGLSSPECVTSSYPNTSCSVKIATTSASGRYEPTQSDRRRFNRKEYEMCGGTRTERCKNGRSKESFRFGSKLGTSCART